MKRTRALCTTLIAGVVLGLSIAEHSETNASPLVTRVPSGSSPADALDMIGDWTSRAGSSNVWYRIRPRDQKQLEIRLVSDSAILKKMEFLVYAAVPDGSEPSLIGRGQAGETRTIQEWMGAAVDGATDYVNVVNDSALPAD